MGHQFEVRGLGQSFSLVEVGLGEVEPGCNPSLQLTEQVAAIESSSYSDIVISLRREDKVDRGKQKLFQLLFRHCHSLVTL